MNEHETDHFRELMETAKHIDHLCDDFEKAWLAGDRPQIEAYLDRIGETQRPNLLRELLQVELDAQLARGDRPDRERYVQRFPEHADLIDSVLGQDTPRGSSGSTLGTDESVPTFDADGFKILKELNRGGQAIVYQALQLSTKRKVALKILIEGPFLGAEQKRRFEREIELVGSLRHPGIVSIFDSGVCNGRCYYAMEYIRGCSLTQYVQSQMLAARETLQLFARVCDAVDYAHQRGVIHRDLKPSNILVDGRGDPHVLDFGLAKIAGAEGTAHSLVSRTGQIVGTPAYMSPEQAAGQPDEVDMRSDVYSLGVILYELLTGQAPYDVSGPLGDVLQTIRQTPPRRPSLTGTSVNSEVETIVLKTLDKDKQRRYDTAGALRRDIGRYLEGEPIEAKRDSALYVLRKTLRRYRTAAAVAFTILMLVTASTVALSFLYYQAVEAGEQARAAAEKETRAREETRLQLYISDMNSAADAWEKADLSRMFRLLDRHRPPAHHKDVYGFEWYLLWEHYLSTLRQTRLAHENEIRSLVFTPDGKTLVTATDDQIRLWDVASRRFVASQPSGRASAIRSMAISSDGGTLALGFQDRTVVLWDFATRRPRATLPQAAAGMSELAFSPDNKVLATIRSGRLELWAVDSGTKIREVGELDFWGFSTAFSSDSKKIATGSYGVVHLWELDTNKQEEIRHDKSNIRCVAFSPDDQVLALAGDESVVRFHHLAGGRQPTILRGHLAPIDCAAFSPDGKLFATGSYDRTVRLWKVSTAEELAVLRGHTSKVMCLAFSSDGKTFATGCGDGEVILWDVSRPDPHRLELHQSPVQDLAFSPDDTKLASTGFKRHPSLVLWDVVTGRGESLTEGDLHAQVVAFSPVPSDQTLVAGIGGTLRVWDLNTKMFSDHTTKDGEMVALAYAPDGKRLASAARAKATIWNTETWSQVKQLAGPEWIHSDMSFSPDGELLATPTGHNEATVYDTKSWAKVPMKIQHFWPLHDVAFSHDGRMLATVCQEGLIKLWDMKSRRQIGPPLVGETSGLYTVGFSPDGKTLVAAGVDSRINVWKLNLEQPALVATLRGHTSSIVRLAFSTDGRILATGSEDGTVRLWRTASDRTIASTEGAIDQ